MKRIIISISFFVLTSCGETKYKIENTKDSSNKVVSNKVDTMLLMEDNSPDVFFSNREFKKIGNDTGIDMLYGDNDTLHIVGAFDDSYSPQIGSNLTEFISKIFQVDDYTIFSKYTVIEHSSDLAADDCARYFFEDNKLKEIKGCQ